MARLVAHALARTATSRRTQIARLHARARRLRSANGAILAASVQTIRRWRGQFAWRSCTLPRSWGQWVAHCKEVATARCERVALRRCLHRLLARCVLLQRRRLQCSLASALAFRRHAYGWLRKLSQHAERGGYSTLASARVRELMHAGQCRRALQSIRLAVGRHRSTAALGLFLHSRTIQHARVRAFSTLVRHALPEAHGRRWYARRALHAALSAWPVAANGGTPRAYTVAQDVIATLWRERYLTPIEPTSPGPHVTLVPAPGPHVTLVLTSPGPYVTLARQARAASWLCRLCREPRGCGRGVAPAAAGAGGAAAAADAP